MTLSAGDENESWHFSESVLTHDGWMPILTEFVLGLEISKE